MPANTNLGWVTSAKSSQNSDSKAHMWKSKIGLLEQISAKNPYVTFFLGHPVEGTPFSEIIMVMLRRLG